MFDDVIYRYNEKENELELYVGNGKWELKEGMYADYLTGVHSSVWSIDEDKALQIIKNFEDETYYNNRGLCYYESGEYNKAIQDFTKIIALNTDDYGDLICLVRSGVALAYQHRADCYRELGELEKAISDYSESIKLMSDNCTAYNNRGEIYEMLGEYEKAISDYYAAIETDVEYYDNSIYFYNRGRAYFLAGKYDEAASDFLEAIEIDYPIEEKNCEPTILLLNDVIKFNSNYADAYLYRGECYKILGKSNEAKADFKKAEELNQIMV